MQLISLPVSPFAARVRIAIYAKGLEIELVPPPSGWPRNDQFRDVCPTGRIPVLLLDRGPLWESAVLLEYLEDRYPGAPALLPSDPYDRAKARLLVRHTDQYLMPPMVELAKPGIEAAASRRSLAALADGLAMLDGLLSGGRYAAADRLSFADCALAPALFAAQVTEKRAGVELIASTPAVEEYCLGMRGDPHIARVLDEMEDGLKLLSRQG